MKGFLPVKFLVLKDGFLYGFDEPYFVILSYGYNKNVYSSYSDKFPVYHDNEVPKHILDFINELRNNVISIETKIFSRLGDFNTKIFSSNYPIYYIKTINYLIALQEKSDEGIIYGTFKKYT